MKLEALIDEEMDKLTEIDEYYQKPANYRKGSSKEVVDMNSLVIEYITQLYHFSNYFHQTVAKECRWTVQRKQFR